MKKLSYILFAATLLWGCTQNPDIADPTIPVHSNGLVIEAACQTTTRTDINEGKSTWEAGDIITVVYDGTAYTYTTAEEGATAHFTSEAGIQSYDSSKPLTAYYPATDAEGTVSIDAVRKVTFADDAQKNVAQAPLVGLPKGVTGEGELSLSFKNVFSVLELRIDAGTLASKGTSLTVEPADEASFDGFITFTGTVDPETLALTPAAEGEGTTLTLEFGEGADMTKPLTVKFPVGRFTSEAGLKLTLATEDGESYSKDIFKNGIETFTESDGVYSAKHIAKALYALGASGSGISSAEELAAFRDAVNAGESIAQWVNEDGKVVLLDDIDMADVKEWTPIGDGTFTWASNNISSIKGNPFTGHFDGRNHSIKNFAAVCNTAGVPDGNESAAWGLFGMVQNATVENLVFDESSSLTVNAKRRSDVGILAGFCYNSDIRNIVNHAPLTVSGEANVGDNRLTTAIVGFAFAGGGNVNIVKCMNHGAVTAEDAGNTTNGATCLQTAGILGFGTNLNGSTTDIVTVSECENHGRIETKAARAAGIVAAANRYTAIVDCKNYGDNYNHHPQTNGGRIGNITCITGAGSRIATSINYGDCVSTTSARIGGIISLVNDATCDFDRVENYGNIVSDNATSGTIFSYCNNAATFWGCVAQGDFGTYNDGSFEMVGLNAANYFKYAGSATAAAVNVTPQNIIWAAAEAGAEFSVTPATAQIDVWGTSSVVAELSAADYDWTATGDEWLHTWDLTGEPQTEGTKSDKVQYLRITADRNGSSAPRTGTVTFTAKEDSSKSAVMTVTQDAVGPAFPSVWQFAAANLETYGPTWTEGHILPATSGSAGVITAVRGEENAGTALQYTIYGNKPTINTMVEGDYWLYTFPVDHLDAGSAIEFDATMGSGSQAAKYWIVEYFEDGEWKCNEDELHTAPEDPSVKYTYMSSGDIASSTYEHPQVIQTFRLKNAIDNGELLIRARVASNLRADDAATPTKTGTLGRTLFPLYGFTASYVYNHGTAQPKDTKTILCLGNSFSYYNHPVWMLKEIAYSQGHYLRVHASLKGSQQFSQHLDLKLSNLEIGYGGYDYVFLQDKSQHHSWYADGEDHGETHSPEEILEATKEITARIKEKSPQCQTILEQTWAFSASSYNSYGSYELFDRYLEEGASAIAQANGSWMSPIGQAFKEARKNSKVKLYYTDNKHQSPEGAYLKACVNYLVLYGEPFDQNAPDCGIDPTNAAYLRGVAEQVVLGNEEKFFIRR